MVAVSRRVALKSRFESETGNALHCSSGVNLEGGALERAFPVGDWERGTRGTPLTTKLVIRQSLFDAKIRLQVLEKSLVDQPLCYLACL
ncbi:MAG: hypothetical protein ACYT04_11405 [Nostoc sp.]